MTEEIKQEIEEINRLLNTAIDDLNSHDVHLRAIDYTLGGIDDAIGEMDNSIGQMSAALNNAAQPSSGGLSVGAGSDADTELALIKDEIIASVNDSLSKVFWDLDKIINDAKLFLFTESKPVKFKRTWLFTFVYFVSILCSFIIGCSVV